MRLIPRLHALFDQKRSHLSILEVKTPTPSIQANYGKKPTVSFHVLRNWYLTDPSVKAAIDDLASQVVGPGFYIRSSSDHSEAKKIIDDFNAAANIDQWLQIAATELAYAGNSFTPKPDDWRKPVIS